MTALRIVEYPDDVLSQIAAPINEFGNTLAELVERMAGTLDEVGGIGLSAPQVGSSLRIALAKLDDGAISAFINPTITASARPGFVQESCLSIPGVVGHVTRATMVTVSAQNVHGELFEMQLSGMPAVCLQHEIDHLNGVLFIDRLNVLQKLYLRLKNPHLFKRPSLVAR